MFFCEIDSVDRNQVADLHIVQVAASASVSYAREVAHAEALCARVGLERANSAFRLSGAFCDGKFVFKMWLRLFRAIETIESVVESHRTRAPSIQLSKVRKGHYWKPAESQRRKCKSRFGRRRNPTDARHTRAPRLVCVCFLILYLRSLTEGRA